MLIYYGRHNHASIDIADRVPTTKAFEQLLDLFYQDFTDAFLDWGFQYSNKLLEFHQMSKQKSYAFYGEADRVDYYLRLTHHHVIGEDTPIFLEGFYGGFFCELYNILYDKNKDLYFQMIDVLRSYNAALSFLVESRAESIKEAYKTNQAVQEEEEEKAFEKEMWEEYIEREFMKEEEGQ